MKEIKAFIKPNRVGQIVGALNENGFDNVTISMAEGTGSYKRPDAFPSLEFKITDSKVVKLELVCKKKDVEQIVQLISEHGHSPEKGDGIIYVSNVEKTYRVKTGKENGQK
jgi:nitrogen regulatory protein P-II 1